MRSGIIRWVIKNNKRIRLMAIIEHIRAQPGATQLQAIIQLTTATFQITMAILKIMAVATFLVWSSYIWLNATTFGPTPECNAKVKVIGPFYNPVSATNSTLPIFWILGLGGAVAGIITAIILIIREGRRRSISDGGLIEAIFSSKGYSEAADDLSQSALWIIPSIFLVAHRKMKRISCTRVAVYSIIWLEILVRTSSGLDYPSNP
jgi:hypothetical protein